MRQVKIQGLSIGTSVMRILTKSSRPFSSGHAEALFVCCVCGKEFPSAAILKAHYNFRHTAAILNLLRKDPINTYTRIFEKQVQRQNNCELRFGNGLVVNVR